MYQVDDEHDVDVVSQLIDPHPPDGFFVTATESLPGLDELEVVRNLQMFTQIWRSRIASSQPTSSMHKHFHKLLQVGENNRMVEWKRMVGEGEGGLFKHNKFLKIEVSKLLDIFFINS